MKAFHQLLATLSYGDAISDEARTLRDYARARGLASEIFVHNVHPRYRAEVRSYRELNDFDDPEALALLHFSLGSPVVRAFLRLRARRALIYHNITPAHFFHDVHPRLAKECARGRDELAALAPQVELAFGDSEFNRAELEALGFTRTAVQPIPIDFARFRQPPDPLVVRAFNDHKANLLCVGRVIPNKRLEQAIKVYAYYKKYVDHESRLLLVGEYRGFENYLQRLQRLAATIDLEEVYFASHVRFEQLLGYYAVADVLLHVSDHEGFCVPLLEAFDRGVPVVAYAAGAVAETVGHGAVLLREKRLDRIAEVIHRLRRDQALRQAVISRQRQELSRFEPGALAGRLLDRLAAL
jgi:glycosyltransferase involved in cell wall biosynthesis